MKSMTGYGQGSLETLEFCGSLEISSVNKRGFELVFHLPREWQVLERLFARIIRGKINRGRIRVALNLMNTAESGAGSWLNESVVSQELERLKKFCTERKIPHEPNAELVYRIASSLKDQSFLPPADKVESSLLRAVEKALDGLIEMRLIEGEALKEDLHSRINHLHKFLIALSKSSQGMAREWKDKLFIRLQEQGLEIDESDERVVKEIALFADKSDISEELTRIASHLEQFKDCLDSAEPVGRKLEFITQELLREFNTLGSKSARPECTKQAIDAKVELEKIREQISNIE